MLGYKHFVDQGLDKHRLRTPVVACAPSMRAKGCDEAEVHRVARDNCPHVIVGPPESDLEVVKAILNRAKVELNCALSSPQ